MDYHKKNGLIPKLNESGIGKQESKKAFNILVFVSIAMIGIGSSIVQRKEISR